MDEQERQINDFGFSNLDGANGRIKALEASLEPLREENAELKEYLFRLIKAFESSHNLYFGFIRDIKSRYGDGR